MDVSKVNNNSMYIFENFFLCSGIWKETRRQSNFRLRPPSDNFSLHWSRLVSVPRPVFFFTFHSFWTCYAASVPGHMSRNWRKFDQNFNWSPCSDLGSRKIDLPHAAHPWPHICDMYILRACTCRNFRLAGEWAEIDGRPTRVVIMLIEVLPPDSCPPPSGFLFPHPARGGGRRSPRPETAVPAATNCEIIKHFKGLPPNAWH